MFLSITAVEFFIIIYEEIILDHTFASAIPVW